MRILGIDPGYATIGFGLVEAQRAQVCMVTYGPSLPLQACPSPNGSIKLGRIWRN